MKTGYFAEVREFSRYDVPGKLFARQMEKSPSNDSISFPSISGLAFDRTPIALPLLGKTHFIGVYYREFGRNAVELWEKRLGVNCVPFYEVSVIERSLTARSMHSMFKGYNLRKNYEEKGRPLNRGMFWFDHFIEQKQQLGITNRVTGYVYLVDSKGRIRWKVCGEPFEQEEVEDALRFFKQLEGTV